MIRTDWVRPTIALASDPLGFLQSVVDHADPAETATALRLRGQDTFILTSAAVTFDVLTRWSPHTRLDRLSRGLGDVLGNSLLVTDGPHWRDQRKRAKRCVDRDARQGWSERLTRIVADELDTWPDLGVVDFYPRMNAVALAGATDLLFGGAGTADLSGLGVDLQVLMRLVRGVHGTGLRVPMAVPTPGNLRARVIGGRMREQIGTLRSARAQVADVDVDDLLTLLLVGHETVALALTFTLHLLATHEDVQADLRTRLAEDGDAEAVDSDAGALLDACLREAMRLYPPVWAMGRETVAQLPLESGSVRPGSQLLVPIAANHRRLDWYDSPHDFCPDRWLDGRTAGNPLAAFMPFGMGTRRCLGERAAWITLRSVVTAVLRRYRLIAVTGAPRLEPTVTLRPRSAVHALVERLGDPTPGREHTGNHWRNS